MADDVLITAGIGTSVATDEVGVDHYQKMKLADGTANSADMIPGDATSGLFVNPKRSILRVQAVPTVSTGAYTAGDQLGTLMTLASAARVAANGGFLRGVTLLDKTTAVRPTMELYLFDRSVTVAADNAPATFSDADMAFCLGSITIATTDYQTAVGTPVNSIASLPSWESAANAGVPAQMGIPYVCEVTSLFVAAVIRSASTLTSTSDLTFSYTLERF